MVVGLGDPGDVVWGQLGQVGLAGEERAQPAVGILHAALLPGGAGVAEEGLGTQVVELVMAGELGAVVEGDGPAPLGREGSQQLGDGIGHALGVLGGQGTGEQQAGVAFLEGEQGLALVAKEHQVGFPVAGSSAVVGFDWALGDVPTMADKGSGTAALAPSAAPLGLAAGQQVAPGIVLAAVDLGLNEAVDGLVGDDGASGFQSQATGHLFGRPASLEAGVDGVAQGGVSVQLGTAPAPGPGLVVGVAGPVAILARRVAIQLPRNCRWRAIQLCRDLAL